MPQFAGFRFEFYHGGTAITRVKVQAVDTDGAPFLLRALVDVWLSSDGDGFGVPADCLGSAPGQAARMTANEMLRPCHGVTFVSVPEAAIFRLQTRADGCVGIAFSMREFPLYVAAQCGAMTAPSVSRALTPADFGPIPDHEVKLQVTKR